MPPKGRIYWRKQGKDGRRRAYADFRDFEDVGGKQIALRPKGARAATDDPIVAEALAKDLLAHFQEKRRNKAVLGIEREANLSDFVEHHLREKERAGRITPQWLHVSRKHLSLAVEFFGPERDISTIAVQDVQEWQTWLSRRKGQRGRRISSGTLRHFLNTFSNLFRRAASEGYVQPGYNPVAAMLDKPVANREEAAWLEVHDATRLLEAARTYQPKRDDVAIPFIYPLLVTFLLTGGRQAEVLGLTVQDISFDRRTVTFRPNQWRRLKTRGSHRTVPLWPQLEEVLREYLSGENAPTGRLLFPATRVENEQPISDVRKALDAVAKKAGWASGEIRTKAFRHTYCTARLQTLDGGYPVSPWTVARELGHGSTSMIERVYGHLGHVRHRSDVVEYRVPSVGMAAA